MTIVWELIAFLAALVGGYLVLTSLSADYSAPQTAAQAAVGIGIAAIPYFIASMAQRSVIIRRLKAKEKQANRDAPASPALEQLKDFLIGRD